VNGYWICDEGRYGYLGLDRDRIGRVLALQPQPRELAWEAALDEIAVGLERGIRGKGSEGLAVVASGALSNEDWGGLRSLFVSALGAGRFLFTPEPDQVGEEDALLRKREKVPNLKGGEAQGFGSTIPSATFESLAGDIEAGRVWGLYVIDRDPAAVWGERTRALLARLDLVVYQGPWQGATGELADYRLPATAYVEEEGHFTNFEGRVQAYRKALEPLGEAQPDWWIFRRLEERCQALAERGPVAAAARP
ncbi:MAG: molybdopterin-dependent oxidoreductase, partial [Thermoanaerobaculia bacterium]